MNIHSNDLHEFRPRVAPVSNPETRPMYWSIRRELWENRSVYMAPLIVAAVVLLGLLINMIGLPEKMRTLPTDPVKRHEAVVTPYSVAPAPIMFVTFLVGMFYAVDALYGDRRDRSILFWKSLPVSDLTAVLSKASIPFVVLPLIAVVLGTATQAILIALSTAVLLVNGMSAAPLWTEFRFIDEPLIMLYGLAVHVLWYAPIYGWLLFVSAWARRAPFLWAVIPPFAIAAVEAAAFQSTNFLALLNYRWSGAMTEGFAIEGIHGEMPLIDRLPQLTPANFLSTPALWTGLVVAVAFLAAAVRLRRNREPV